MIGERAFHYKCWPTGLELSVSNPSRTFEQTHSFKRRLNPLKGRDVNQLHVAIQV